MPNGYTIKPNGLQGKECAMSTTKDLLNVLGGASIIRKRIESTRDMAEAIRQGIPYLSLIALATAAHLELNKMSTVLMIPMRTMARRRESKRLTAEESDRLVRLARIFTHAINVFGDRDKAAKWIQRPNRALRNTAPIDTLDTDLGVQEVETILGRIEYGVYS